MLSRPQPEAVLAPVSYRSSRRRRQRKRLLLKVPNIKMSRARRGKRLSRRLAQSRIYHSPPLDDELSPFLAVKVSFKMQSRKY